MKRSIATVFATLIIAGTATADGLPCSKTQLWVTSLPTVPASHTMHESSGEVNIASVILQPRADTKIAKFATDAKRI